MPNNDLTNTQVLEALKAFLKDELKAFAKKEDLKEFITKEDARSFATKEDLKTFATKEDLKAFATKGDLHTAKTDLQQSITRLEQKLDSYQKVNVQHHLAVRSEVGDLNRKFGELRGGLAYAAGLA